MRKFLEPTARSYSLPVTDSSLNPLAQSFDVNRNQTASFNSQLMYAPHMSNSNNQFHKLPKLELSKFDGNILNWQAFWESYDTAIHSNPSLTDAQKFNYLKTLLQNEALTTVSGFTLTNLNYSKAIDLLHQRFGQTQKITHTYMQTLLALPAPDSTVQSCRRFYDKSETLIRGLESLGQSQESYGALLIPIMLNKLPSRIKENITREHGLKQWSLDELRQHLFNEISILEAGQRVNLESDETLHSTVYLAKTDTKNNYNNNNRKPQRSEVAVHTRKPCIYCGESHSPNTCMKIVDQKARLEILKQKKACFNCLGNHRVTDCKSKGTCKQCGRKHHTSICLNKSQSSVSSNSISNRNNKDNKPASSDKQDIAETASAMHCTTYSQVLLKTAIATVHSNAQVSMDANILFDEGAQRSFITESLAEQLELKQNGTEAISISGFGGGNGSIRHLKTADIFVLTEDGSRIQLNILIVPEIASPIRIHTTETTNLPYLRGLKLAHPLSGHDVFCVNLLIGADHYWDFMEDKIIRGNGPTAVKSRIGYLLSGPTQKSTEGTTSMMNILIGHKEEEYDLENFWKIESLGITPQNKEKSNAEYLENFISTNISYDANTCKYTAKLPWKDDHEPLPSNIDIARRRTENVVRRLSNDPFLLRKYGEIINDQEKRGFIERIDNPTTSTEHAHYIPHHSVKKDSATTPIRIVYDCSCRRSQDTPSLNDCLRKEPPILNDISTLLMRFRENRYAVVTDIEKAFLQITLDEKDRDMTRFFWLKDSTDPTSKLITYRFKAILFGATCSPFILNATLLKHLREQSSHTSETLIDGLYVDNIIAGFDNTTELLKSQEH
ncbi:uncharacterized protein LOC134716543 [Mytilus trossulus]|uniref:uncharacterized protein LOC134716543 n=1 Tax=Mytilus trossulus TaxID=6551 RepID=UPI003003D20F